VASRLTQLRKDAAEKGFAVFRHSPGDGVSRYAFFKRPVKKDQGYFGPANPECVALGLKKAKRFLETGTCPVTRKRGG